MLGIEIFLGKEGGGKFYCVANKESMLVSLMVFILMCYIGCARKRTVHSIWNIKLNILLLKQRKAVLLRQSEQNKWMILYRILGGLELEFRGILEVEVLREGLTFIPEIPDTRDRPVLIDWLSEVSLSKWSWHEQISNLLWGLHVQSLGIRTVSLFLSWICSILIYMQVRKKGGSWVTVEYTGVSWSQCSVVCLEKFCKCLRGSLLSSSPAIQTLPFSVSTR